jgi:hypothetical protein
MSFGIGIGDIIALGKFASKICQRFVNAPEQFKTISDESVAPAVSLRILIPESVGFGASQLSFKMSKPSYRSESSPASRSQSWME